VLNILLIFKLNSILEVFTLDEYALTLTLNCTSVMNVLCCRYGRHIEGAGSIIQTSQTTHIVVSVVVVLLRTLFAS